MSTVSYRHHQQVQAGTLAAGLAVFALVALGAFQLALALGTPFGQAAWGGDSADLTSAQRFGSVGAVVIYAAAAAVLLARVGPTTRPRTLWLLKWGPWFFAGLFALSALANFASQSHWENYLLGPAGLLLAGLCAVVGRTPLRSGRSSGREAAGTLRGFDSRRLQSVSRTGCAQYARRPYTTRVVSWSSIRRQRSQLGSPQVEDASLPRVARGSASVRAMNTHVPAILARSRRQIPSRRDRHDTAEHHVGA